MSLVLLRYCTYKWNTFISPANFRFLSESVSTYCHVVVSTKAAVVVYSLRIYTSATVGLSIWAAYHETAGIVDRSYCHLFFVCRCTYHL